ncbi:MAG TPA: hypothetical protein VFE33_22635 [Thermoanaerobaculia bacterium]|nr:hypothetical protein [Thermoanaerobaculia bacterium]
MSNSAKRVKRRSPERTDTETQARYPRHSLEKVLRVPRAILDQNAGRECSDADVARFIGLKLTGPTRVEISSAIKFGLLDRPGSGRLKVTDLAKKILRPQEQQDELAGLREAILNAPDISDVYRHYRGENLPDEQFFDNALVDTFHIPQSKLSEFKALFMESLEKAQLLERHNGKVRVLDFSQETGSGPSTTVDLKKLGRAVTVDPSDSCFVVMPFAAPLGLHYSLIYEPAIRKAGLKPMRADDDIFSTGKIIDQVWSGIKAAKVLVAELTSRNPNVFYELGLAHALRKPVVLVSANEQDVPFDVRHIRVIYYDVNDPFWGDKLLSKIAENILSALKNPAEAIFKAEEE